MVISEKKTMGAIRLRYWRSFFNFGVGTAGILMILISSANVSGLLIYLNYLIGEWADSSEEQQEDPFFFNVLVVVIFLTLLLSFLRCMITAL